MKAKAKSFRLKLNSQGFKEMMSSDEASAELEARAERIAAAAGGAPDFEVSVTTNRDRAVAFIRSATEEGYRSETERRALSRALDAGR